jgi:hypothetical protein
MDPAGFPYSITHNDWVQVDPVHVEPFDLLQIFHFGLCRLQPLEPHVRLLHLGLHLLCLRGEEAELRRVPGSVAGKVKVTKLS